MLINLIGPVTFHPYIDRMSLSFLTRNTRTGITDLHNGIVYEQASGKQIALPEDTMQAREGYIRTSVPLLSAHGRHYVCGHVWLDTGETKHSRITHVRLDQDIMIVTGEGGPEIVMDLGVELDFEPITSTLWDVLTA